MERPPYDAVPIGDTVGLRHVRETLEDLEFPIKTSELRARAGAWRMPVTGTRFETLGEWLEGVPETQFRHIEDVVAAMARAHPELRE